LDVLPLDPFKISFYLQKKYENDQYRAAKIIKSLDFVKTSQNLVFLESDIINYEANKKELLDADYKYWHTHIKWTFKK